MPSYVFFLPRLYASHPFPSLPLRPLVYRPLSSPAVFLSPHFYLLALKYFLSFDRLPVPKRLCAVADALELSIESSRLARMPKMSRT